MDEIILKNPIDMHLHIREKDLLTAVLPFSSTFFSSALIMPNLKNPILDSISLNNYENEINFNLNNIRLNDINLTENEILESQKYFIPLMSIYFNESLTENELLKVKNFGCKFLKLYPKGATTNSDNGVNSVLSDKTLKIFELAQKLGFILCVHAETNGFSLERESEFFEVFEILCSNFPSLKIIFEHVSDRRSIGLIEKLENLYGTITLHHILLTLDDVIGKELNPFAFCKPICKTEKDREVILKTALNAHPKFSFGSDSAPHTLESKCNCGAAGIFSSPIVLNGLASIFAHYNKLDNLQNFISDNAISIYDLNIPFKKYITLKKQKCNLPKELKFNSMILKVFSHEIISDYSISNIRFE